MRGSASRLTRFVSVSGRFWRSPRESQGKKFKVGRVSFVRSEFARDRFMPLPSLLRLFNTLMLATLVYSIDLAPRTAQRRRKKHVARSSQPFLAFARGTSRSFRPVATYGRTKFRLSRDSYLRDRGCPLRTLRTRDSTRLSCHAVGWG